MPLKGVRVLEIAGLAASPFTGMILSDFGASVIRVDRNPSHSMVMDVTARGKKSLSVDLKIPDGRDIVMSLASKSDVFIESFRPGVMERLGLGPDVLTGLNPELIYARLTGYGQSSGPYKHRAGHDINYIGLSGILSTFGRANEKPLPPGNIVADFAGGGLTSALGILAALYERSTGGAGKGQIIDSGMNQETIMPF